ncbi:MAG: class I SAM-dependent methyltransferase [Balneolaceae bacterium]|nr:class I SAM-dependent methyltransferase [Balneolaceae bacterium]
MMWWNNKVNLVSRDVSHETLFEHIKHSLLISTTQGFQMAQKIIDTGTGGGLPGVPLAICFPEKSFILNDIVKKKMMVAKHISSKLNLKNIVVNSGPIAEVEVKGYTIISKHAFKVFELIDFLAGKQWNEIIFLKGESEVEGELKKIDEPFEVKITCLDKVLESEFYRGKSIVELKRTQSE